MTKPILNLRGKKILLFGLGSLGGGVATANWLMRQGAQLTISDTKVAEQLVDSVAQLKGQPLLHLGAQLTEDIDANEIIVLNPGVSVRHPLVEYARQQGKRIVNEATLFYGITEQPKLAVTGTRGKTTTAAWADHFLKTRYRSALVGNATPDFSKPLLEALEEQASYDYSVTELSSFLLELFDDRISAPHIAIITSISVDHLNRYASMEEYVRTKANIFKNQTPQDHLILNQDDHWTDFFLKQSPCSHVWYVSRLPLSADKDGLWSEHGQVKFQKDGITETVLQIKNFAQEWGLHNLQNLLASALAAHCAGISWQQIQEAIASLPQIPFRQEIIFKNNDLMVINDSAATSPEGSLAAIRRFAGAQTILITGGTDAQLDYSQWAQESPTLIAKENCIFLSGSATDSMLSSLAWTKDSVACFETLRGCVEAAFTKVRSYPSSTILFSPGAKSFEKFNNEFDRGQQFNDLVQGLIHEYHIDK